MNEVLKLYLSLSFSGSLLILALLLSKNFLKARLSRQCQYYLWLLVIARLLLPFAPEANLVTALFQAAEHISQPAGRVMISQSDDRTGRQTSVLPVAGSDLGGRNMEGQPMTIRGRPLFRDMVLLLKRDVWLIWAMAALLLLIRRITAYRSFVRYVKAGRQELAPTAASTTARSLRAGVTAAAADTGLPDRLAEIAEQEGIRESVELCVNPLISSPLLIGFFHPCIVLPDTNLKEEELRFIALHELTHYRRRDMLYKWLVQITLCLHWFNPLVYLMGREINRACEFSCDEAVISRLMDEDRRQYAKTLLHAMRAAGSHRKALASVSLSEGKELLKERLGAIVNYKKRTKQTVLVTLLVTALLAAGATAAGAYTAPETKTAAEIGMVYEDGVYYLFGDGADENDKPIGGVTEGALQIVFVRKDGYASIGPLAPSEQLEAEVRAQCESMVRMDYLTAGEADRIISAARSIRDSTPLRSSDEETLAQMSASDSRRQQSLIEDSEPYRSLGLIYDASRDAMFYNGRRVKAFVDLQKEGYLAFQMGYFDNAADGLYLMTEHDEGWNVTGIREMSEDLKEEIDEVYENREPEPEKESPSLQNSYYMTFDAATTIGEGISATDKFEPEEIPPEISQWISSCREPGVAYVKSAVADGRIDGWICCSSGKRRGWQMEAADGAIRFTLLDHTPKEIDGPTVIHYQAPLSYQNLEVRSGGELLEVKRDKTS